MEGKINLIIYLHDTPYNIDSQVAANKSNIDTIESIENYLYKDSNVVLSADDGYKSVKNLLPLLEKYDVKLLFFVTTGFIDKSVYPYEIEISNYLEKNSSCEYQSRSFSLETNKEKESFFKLIHQRLKPMSLSQREHFLNDLFLENGAKRQVYQKDIFMGWDELIEIAKHPLVEIGSHCVSHLYLPSHNIADIYCELKESKRKLEYELENKVSKLSFPYGGNDFKVRLLAKIAGYKKAYGTHNKESKTMNHARIELKELI